MDVIRNERAELERLRAELAVIDARGMARGCARTARAWTTLRRNADMANDTTGEPTIDERLTAAEARAERLEQLLEELLAAVEETDAL